VELDLAVRDGPTFTFRGGCTVVLDGNGRLKYVIGKRIDSEDRLARQRAYLVGTLTETAATAYRGRVLARASLASLHRGI
jgi:hypothetical protein